MVSQQDLRHFLEDAISEKFPFNVGYSFAYGSAIFEKTENEGKSKNMIDVILIVDDPYDFHDKNLRLNPGDYSSTRFLGSKLVTKIGSNWSAGVYFNPMCMVGGRMFKYGVVSRSKLLEDLENWSYLYVAGRLHKPVMWISRNADDLLLNAALSRNFTNAVRAARLFLPENFSEVELYKSICNLSYAGDIRTFFGLDLKKSSKIVNGNIEGFQKLYQPILLKLSEGVVRRGTSSLQQDMSPRSILTSISHLPASLRRRTADYMARRQKSKDFPTVSDAENIRQVTASSLRSIVFYSSANQTVKGLISSGFSKTFSYVTAKVTKAIR